MMSWRDFGWQPYVPVAERRARAASEMARLAKRTGNAATPVVLAGRTIARTFWGKAWCDNLEAYSDFANRLPRGRSYERNGSVVDLQIAPGKVTAMVAGSELYRIEIKIKPVAPQLWKTIQSECAGKIDSLIELLQGRLSSAVMQLVTRQDGGLFPAPREIDLDCSCPDWADLCKHVAASLYGVGARLDSKPELLFVLRGVDPADLISGASAADAVRQTASTTEGAPVMSEAEVADVFGIELGSGPAAPAPAAEAAPPPSVPAAAPTPAPASASASRRKRETPRRPDAAAEARLAAAAKGKGRRAKRKSRKPKPAIGPRAGARARKTRAGAQPEASAPPAA